MPAKTLTELRAEAEHNLKTNSDPFEKEMNKMLILSIDKTLEENPEIN
jgi:hypothetical protein